MDGVSNGNLFHSSMNQVTRNSETYETLGRTGGGVPVRLVMKEYQITVGQITKVKNRRSLRGPPTSSTTEKPEGLEPETVGDHR